MDGSLWSRAIISWRMGIFRAEARSSSGTMGSAERTGFVFDVRKSSEALMGRNDGSA